MLSRIHKFWWNPWSISVEPVSGLESGIHDSGSGIRDPGSGIRDPRAGIWNPRATWISLHRAKGSSWSPLKPKPLHRIFTENVWGSILNLTRHHQNPCFLTSTAEIKEVKSYEFSPHPDCSIKVSEIYVTKFCVTSSAKRRLPPRVITPALQWYKVQPGLL